MDEQPLQAYRQQQLIQELLSCPNGEEGQVIANYPELVDEGLVIMCFQVAQMLEQNGNTQNASRLRNFAGNLLNAQQTQFFMQVLQTIVDNQGNCQAVYPLLRANLNLLNAGLIPIMDAWFRKKLAQADKAQQNVYAAVLVTFGNLIQEFPLGNRADNIEQAIAAYQSALEVRTRQAFPEQWAMTQNNLGTAYRERIRGERAENLEQAIAAYQSALEVYTRQAFPQDWAMTQNNLGIAYRKRIRGERAENLEQAIAAYQSALEVYTRQAFPADCLQTARNLGNLGFTNQCLDIAIEGYTTAVEAVENLRSETLDPNRRAEILSESIEVYANLVQVYVDRGDLDKAIEIADRSKARNLVELLATRDLYPKGDIPQEVINKLNELRRAIAQAERQLNLSKDGATSSQFEDSTRGISSVDMRRQVQEQQAREQLLQHKQELNELIIKEIQPIDSGFSLTQRVEPLAFQDVRKSLGDDRTAVLYWYWYVKDSRLLAFVVTSGTSQPFCFPYPENAGTQLADATTKYLQLYTQANKQWQDELPKMLQDFATILQIDDLLNHIVNLLPQVERLVLVPHHYLHLLPLHALPICNGHEYLMDRFARGVSYVPSLQILQLIQQRHPDSRGEVFLGVQDPTGDLPFANAEVTAISSAYAQSVEVLEGSKANKPVILQALQDKKPGIVHFACHGNFNFEEPLLSALLLGGSKTETVIDLDKCLTLGEIFRLDIRQCRLVVLSACETGLTDSTRLSDEYVGLPSGFIYAGTPSVVSSLWRVSDLSTTILMIRFYERFMEMGVVGTAIKEAQQWLRGVTGEQLVSWVNQIKPQLSEDRTMQFKLEEYAKNLASHEQPFTNPFYWAPFCAIGL